MHGSSKNNPIEQEAIRQFTPLERFTELEGDVRAIGAKLDAVAVETNEKFVALNAQQADLRRGQAQQTELLIELKNRAGGLDLKALLEIGGGVLKVVVALFVIGSSLIAGVLWLATSISSGESSRVNASSNERHHEQAIAISQLDGAVGVLSQQVNTNKQSLDELSGAFVTHTINGHPYVVIGMIDQLKERTNLIESMLREVRESRNTTEDGAARDKKIADLMAEVERLKATKP